MACSSRVRPPVHKLMIASVDASTSGGGSGAAITARPEAKGVAESSVLAGCAEDSMVALNRRTSLSNGAVCAIVHANEVSGRYVLPLRGMVTWRALRHQMMSLCCLVLRLLVMQR